MSEMKNPLSIAVHARAILVRKMRDVSPGLPLRDWMRPLRLRDLSTDGFAPRLAGLKIARTFPASSVRATNLYAAMSILTTPCPRSRTVDMLV